MSVIPWYRHYSILHKLAQLGGGSRSGS